MDHRSAPVALREQLAMLAPEWPTLLRATCPAIQEWALVTTCNRWEFYAATTSDVDLATAQLQGALAALLQRPVPEFAPYLCIYQGEAVARHLCRVTAGLDSIVLGETQIQGQVIDVYAQGVESGTIGPALSILMRTALRVGRRARAETGISAGAVSMSSVALALAEAEGGALAEQRIAVVGAGEMARLALKLLHSRRVRHVTVLNRTPARAESCLLDPSWRALPLDSLPDAVSQADVVFCATRAPGYMITPEMIRTLPTGLRHRKTLIDLALPRDIDPALRDVAGIRLIDIDDLQEERNQGLADRRQAVPQVESLIGEALEEWRQAMQELGIRPLVVELRLKAEEIRRKEMERTLRYLGDVDEGTRAHLDSMTRALVNKLLHEPTMHIKALAQSDRMEQNAQSIRAIFGLDGNAAAHHDPPNGSL